MDISYFSTFFYIQPLPIPIRLTPIRIREIPIHLYLVIFSFNINLDSIAIHIYAKDAIGYNTDNSPNFKAIIADKLENLTPEKVYEKIKEEYDWKKIAIRTKQIYKSVLREYSKSFWA